MSTWMIKGTTLTEYLAACREAATTNLFYHFKRDSRLTAIFEHATMEQGKMYLDLILKQTPWLLDKMLTNDLYGDPVIFNFGASHYYSASTLQYAGVLSNLLHLFGSLDGLRICEIGGGYGGQAKTILDLYKPQCYHIIDLPEVCELQRRYTEWVDCFTEHPTGISYDLVISNYALSEIKNNEEYVRDVLARSAHGYITCNTDFVKLPWSHRRLPDVTGEENNFILVW